MEAGKRLAGLHEVKITGGLLGEKREQMARITVPYIGRAVYDEIPGILPSGAAENFKIAAGESVRNFQGLVSQDSDLFKWMEAAALSLEEEEEEETKERLKETIKLLDRAQQKDGYLNSYYIMNGLKNRWNFLKESCQLYCAGHLLEAAVSLFEAAGDNSLLKIAMRYADCIDRDFGIGEGKIRGYDGHAEIELALYRLYECTGEERYKKLADFFVEERGKQPYFFAEEKNLKEVTGNLVYELSEKNFCHSQSHLPIRQQKEAVGHAVKAMYFYSAAADKARLDQDEELKKTLRCLWKDVTERKMYLTGAIGSSAYGESFTYAYDLPGGLMYGETCAAVGLFLWGSRMLLLENDSRYGDVMERALYNGILCGVSEEGTSFFYTNALEMDPERCRKRKDYMHLAPKRQKWFECPCCPSNLARLLLSVNRYIYTVSGSGLQVQLFAQSTADIGGWHIEQETEYPLSGSIKIKAAYEGGEETKLSIRIPDWCKKFSLTQNGEALHTEENGGYLVIKGRFDGSEEFLLQMEMNPVKVYANRKVKGLAGKTAVMRGPVVYCAEQTDNGELSELFLREKGEMYVKDNGMVQVSGYRLRRSEDSLYTIEPPSRKEEWIDFIPYRLWNNRGEGEMKVFFSEIPATGEERTDM